MPIHGYRCEKCRHEFEVLQQMSDAPLTKCPKCKGRLTKKVYAAGMIFKGSGYYTTDYKSAAKDTSNGASTSAESGSESKPETKAESKGESTSESKSESKKEAKAKAGEKKAS